MRGRGGTTTMACRSRGALIAAAALALLAVIHPAVAKVSKKASNRISAETDELARQQGSVLAEAAGLAGTGKFAEAAAALSAFTTRVDGLERSGGLGSNLLNQMGEYYAAAKETAKAEKAFKSAVKALKNFKGSPTDDEEMLRARTVVNAAEMYRSRGNIAKLKEATGDLEGFVEEMKKALHEIEVDEYRAMVAKELGIYHMKMDELEVAKAYLEYAVELNPAVPKGYANLGLVHHRLDELDEAEEVFLEAIKREPHNANSYANLGTLYAQSGEFEDAKRYLKMALDRDPKHPDASEKLKTLSDIMDSGKDDGDLPKFRSPMKKVGGERRPQMKFEL